MVKCYTKEFALFSGWDCFFMNLERREVFLGVFVYSSSYDQLCSFLFIQADPGFSTEGGYSLSDFCSLLCRSMLLLDDENVICGLLAVVLGGWLHI